MPKKLSTEEFEKCLDTIISMWEDYSPADIAKKLNWSQQRLSGWVWKLRFKGLNIPKKTAGYSWDKAVAKYRDKFPKKI